MLPCVHLIIVRCLKNNLLEHFLDEDKEGEGCREELFRCELPASPCQMSTYCPGAPSLLRTTPKGRH